MSPDEVKCIVCGHRICRKIFTKKGKDFWRCSNCGFQFQFPLPSEQELTNYYDQSYRSGMYKMFADQSRMKALTASQRFSEIRRFVRPGRWLDVGCSTGVFVAQAEKQGMVASGIDMSEEAVAFATRNSLDCFVSRIETFEAESLFDNLTCFDVIEHVRDPVSFVRHANRLLKVGGTVTISTPNVGSLIRKVMGSRWYFYIPEEHLFYFDPRTITILLTRNGFEILRHAKTFKPLTYRYSMAQFREYNPGIFRTMALFASMVPKKSLDTPIPLYIGELQVIARKSASVGG